MEISLAMLAIEAEAALGDAQAGTPLSEIEASLLRLGVAVSVTSLDPLSIDKSIAEALCAGASPAQVQEVVSLISGLGVHSLMATATRIVALAAEAGQPLAEELTAEQQTLWQQHVGDDPFWAGFDRHLPGFLDAMLRLSPTQFSAFFDYCAVPWKSGTVRAQLKELIALASDATLAHRFLPGFRIHLHNAIKLGAGRDAIMGALDIAAKAPVHTGTAYPSHAAP